MSDSCFTGPHISPTVPLVVPQGPNDVEAQRQWEHWQVQRGIERYRASLVKYAEDGSIRRKSLADLEPGQVIAQDLIGPMVEAVRGYQASAVQTIEGGKMAPDASWSMTLLPAETLAAVTVLHALTRVEPSGFTGAAMSLGGRVQSEYDMERWKQREVDEAKAKRQAGLEPNVNLFRLMTKRNASVDERVFRKWAKKAPLFTSGDWSPATKIDVGTTLLTLLVGCNAWFEVVQTRQGQRTVRMFRMTEAGLAWVADRHHQNELMRPFLLPMICEPQDHRYPEVAQHCHDEVDVCNSNT